MCAGPAARAVSICFTPRPDHDRRAGTPSPWPGPPLVGLDPLSSGAGASTWHQQMLENSVPLFEDDSTTEVASAPGGQAGNRCSRLLSVRCCPSSSPCCSGTSRQSTTILG